MDEDVRREFDEIRAILRAVAERQAAAEARWEVRMDRADARVDRMEERSKQMDARFEKRMRGFEKLVQIGMKEIVKLGRAQQRTDRALRAFMNSLRGRGNGHNGSRGR
jgi:hypothetical protein